MKRLSTYYCTYGLLAMLWLFFGLGFQAKAQSTTYPVQINAHLIPPYSLYLSDYYSGTRDRLTLTLINRDQFKPTLNVRLRMTITGAGGVRMQTNDNAYIEPIVVETGAPVRLTQEDLVPYFRTDNILTQGFLTTGKLPEGTVEFCFQAFEAYTGQILSASTCTRAYITSQKPPLLSLPLNNENVSFREPLNLLFQWTPLQQGVANVEYEFILKELWDNGMAVQAAFAYSPEIYRETTRSTSLAYGAMQPALLPGKRYAWCIRAQAREGMDATNVFQNDGYSEVRVFSLQDNCAPPSLVNAVAERKSLALDWPALPEHIGFTISYRLKSTNGTNNEWKEMQTLEPEGKLYGLQNGGVYEYRVGSYCVAGQPLYTEILEATIPDTDSARLAQCGIMPAINLTNQEPLKELKTSETFMANDFPVTVTKVSGSNGNYTGEGWVIIPWLNDAKIAVAFTSITINSDRQMTAGYVDAKYDKTEGGIANLDEVFEGGFDVGNVKTGITKVDHVFDFSIPGVEAFSLNDEGELVITDDEGEPHTVTADDKEGQGNEGNKVVVFPMTVKDKNGNVYQVEKVTETDPSTGEPKEVAKATFIGKQRDPLSEDSFDRKQLDGGIAMVKFERGAGVYAFDMWQDYYEKVSLIKDKYGVPMWSDGYRAPWKFLADGKTDVVLAKIDVKDSKVITDPKNVIFITPKGTEFKSEYNADTKTYVVSLAAGPAGDAQEVYALYPKDKDNYYTLGKLSVATYAVQQYKVVLVPVNNAPVAIDAIKEKLKEIYGPIAVTWDVKKDDNFTYTENYRLMEKGTGLSTYNEDMRALNNQYRSDRAGTFDKAANYLFFLKATGSDQINDRDLTGFMPRGAQYGYIFTSEIPDANIPVVVAHELGHGRWKLFHTFDKHYGGFEQGATDNVMDYKNGSVVAKWQWDVIGDPAMLVSLFEGDGASASVKLVVADVFLNKDKSTFSFATYNGDVITLPKAQLQEVMLNYGTTQFEATADQVPGVLQRFTLKEDGKSVVYDISMSDGTYKTDAGKVYKEASTINFADVDGVIMALPHGKNFVLYKFDHAGLNRYTGIAIAKKDVVKNVIEFPLRPFGKHTAKLVNGSMITQSVDQSKSNCFYCQDASTAVMTDPYWNRPEILYVTKIAQFRVAYPKDFELFTSIKEDWAEPSPVYTDEAAYPRGVWGKFLDLKENKQMIVDFHAKKDLELHFKIMYEQFYAELKKSVAGRGDFWKNLTDAETSDNVAYQANALSIPELQVLDFEKRKIAIKILMKNSVPEIYENALVSLIGVLGKNEEQKMLQFLADDIKFNKVFSKFDDFMGEDNFTRIVTLITSYIETPKTNDNANQQALSPSAAYVSIDLDILMNKQTDGYFIDNDNKIHFYNTVRRKSPDDDPRSPAMAYNVDFLVVPYNETIPVQFWSTFDLVEGKKYVKTQVEVNMPALYVAFLLDKGGTELFSKKAWLVVDGVMLLVGAGEVKVFFTAASWARRIMVASTIIGSTMGIVIESLPSSVISDKLRNRLRILAALLQLPEAVKGIRDIGRSIIKELRASKQGTTVASEKEAIERAAKELEDKMGSAEELAKAAKLARYSQFKKLMAKLEELEKDFPGIKNKFADAFENTPLDEIAKFDEMPELVDTWRKYPDLLNLDMLTAVNKNEALYKGLKGTDLSNLSPHFNALTEAEKIKFLDDFGPGGVDVWKALDANPKLVDVWKDVKYVNKTTRGNPKFLEAFDEVRGNDALKKHAFVGDVEAVTGCHYIPAVDGVSIRFKGGVAPVRNPLGVLKGDIEMYKPIKNSQLQVTGYSWKPKKTGKEPQTFFPDTWTKDEILEQFASALVNPGKANTLKPDGTPYTRMWVAESDSGVRIRWFEDPPGTLTSFFPEW